MDSTLVHPHKIFLKDPQPPPLWHYYAHLVQTQTWPTSKVKWKEPVDGEKWLTAILSRLQTTLRSVYKQKVVWPEQEQFLYNPSPNEYLLVLLQPIANLYNQICRPGMLKAPIKCVCNVFGEFIFGATFTTEDFKICGITAPVTSILFGEIFDSEGRVTLYARHVLSKILDRIPAVPYIILTNFNHIGVFSPPTQTHLEPTFERASSSRPALAIRVISSAYLNRVLPPGVFVNTPDPDLDFHFDENLILPEGPPQDPNQILPDDEVFATFHHNSEFDRATLIRDRERALQFYRWHTFVRKHHSKLVARPKDTITAKTNDVGMIPPTACPFYPFHASELPEDTVTHLKLIQRKSPLAIAGINFAFECSRSFTLEIQSVISEGSERGICTVYRCLITSIDGHPVQSPSLCLKLFDDRFQPLPSPYDEDSGLGEDPHCWFRYVTIAEVYALYEAFAYDKLRPVQGTVVPWFYGCHQFTLSDGTVLSGLLMEYIEGWKVNSEFTRTLSLNRQITIIQSCRHAVRVLDIADVSQRDWHSDQVLLCTNPITKVDHAVLIDFASTTQTWELDEPNLLDNYAGMFRALCLDRDTMGEVGMDPVLVWKYFEGPDDWDPFALCLAGPISGKPTVLKAKNMFPYISPI